MIRFAMFVIIVGLAVLAHTQEQSVQAATSNLKEAYSVAERKRRVAWPVAVLSAALLSLGIQTATSVSCYSTFSTAFVVILSMLNYRAYHLYDEFKKVLVLL